MIKEPKKVDLFTTGRQPSAEEFARISEWIRHDKQKKDRRKQQLMPGRKRSARQRIAKSKA